MATTTQAYCLKRNNHLNDMVVDLEEMLKDENMVDVSLSCEEGIIKAHKIILSACSTYFRQIFSKVQLNNQYPIIIIKDMSFQDLKYIIDFIYRGEITVPQQHVGSGEFLNEFYMFCIMNISVHLFNVDLCSTNQNSWF